MVEPEGECPYLWEGRIEFDCAEHAGYVRQALAVDPELRPQEVARQLRTEGPVLVLTFRAKQMRMLRAAVGTFLDLVALAVRTLEAFQDTIQPGRECGLPVRP
jgi:tRNA threonylcarbamoyladenosine modification (KEOPS) complex  Pcc1 subunit